MKVQICVVICLDGRIGTIDAIYRVRKFEASMSEFSCFFQEVHYRCAFLNKPVIARFGFTSAKRHSSKLIEHSWGKRYEWSNSNWSIVMLDSLTFCCPSLSLACASTASYCSLRSAIIAGVSLNYFVKWVLMTSKHAQSCISQRRTVAGPLWITQNLRRRFCRYPF